MPMQLSRFNASDSPHLRDVNKGAGSASLFAGRLLGSFAFNKHRPEPSLVLDAG